MANTLPGAVTLEQVAAHLAANLSVPSEVSRSRVLPTSHTSSSLIAFEDRIRAHWLAGNIATQVHLCGGNEDRLIDIFTHIRPGDWVFSTHRNHYHALLCGMPEAELEQAILDGRSMFSFRRARLPTEDRPGYDLTFDGCNLVGTAILAGQCGIAAGVAWHCQWSRHPLAHLAPKVWCFLGDGAEEEGHFYEAALWVEANNLPCTFIIEDNGYQMDTEKFERRGDARAMNIKDGCAYFANAYKPLDHFKCVKRYHYTRTYPHAGTGQPIKPLTAEAIRRAQGTWRTQERETQSEAA
jgi:TPP-dependent pyruvate/acetoin dehydrogenase alpha subunit